MIYLILAMVFYSTSVLLITLASRATNTNLVAAIVNSVGALIPIAVVLAAARKGITTTRTGLILAVLGGAAIALFTMAITKSFTENKVGIVTPVVYGGTILLTTVASYFLLKEKISLPEAAGLLLVLAGLVVIIYARATS